jgi:hypothetical protein
MITSIRYVDGQPNHPISPGRTEINLDVNGSIDLTYRRGPQTRTWVGKQRSELWRNALTALEHARFPAAPPRGAVKPDTTGFAISCQRDGKLETVTLVPCAEYAEFSHLMTVVISEITGKEILGFTVPSETSYVSEAREVT